METINILNPLGQCMLATYIERYGRQHWSQLRPYLKRLETSLLQDQPRSARLTLRQWWMKSLYDKAGAHVTICVYLLYWLTYLEADFKEVMPLSIFSITTLLREYWGVLAPHCPGPGVMKECLGFLLSL